MECALCMLFLGGSDPRALFIFFDFKNGCNVGALPQNTKKREFYTPSPPEANSFQRGGKAHQSQKTPEEIRDFFPRCTFFREYVKEDSVFTKKKSQTAINLVL